jgi:hypothetical protein
MQKRSQGVKELGKTKRRVITRGKRRFCDGRVSRGNEVPN